MMIVYLNKNLQRVYRKSREDMLKAYNIQRNTVNGSYGYDITQPYKLALGAPILVCIDGTYIDANDLVKLALNHRTTVSKWVSELRNPDSNNRQVIEFKWSRNDH